MSNQLQNTVAKIHNTMDNNEIYKAEMIGGTHGLTCIFPRLCDIVDYKEQRRVPEQGYPRFIPHPFVVAVQEKHRKDGYEVIAIQTPEAASFVHVNFFDAATQEHSKVMAFENMGNRYGFPEYHADSLFSDYALP